MRCNQRGMALLNVVLILAVLLGMAHVLAEKVWQSTRQIAEANHREQVFWAAQAGIETARQRLAVAYARSGGWQTLLTAPSAGLYPTTPFWVSALNGIEVELFIRDNPDGDDDTQRDNDLKVFVLARARGRAGVEAMVESLCGFTPPARAASAAGSWSAAALATQTVASYGIAD